MKFFVIGDTIADIYVHGAVPKLAPERCRVFVESGRIGMSPGGAALVAQQIRMLGHQVDLATRIGVDETGEEIRNSLVDADINLLSIQEGTTDYKMRYMDGMNAILRVDSKPQPCSPLLGPWNEYDHVVISDYGRGVLDAMDGRITSVKTKIWVDPWREDTYYYERLGRLFCVTPCVEELKRMACINDADAAVQRLLNNVEHVAVTMGCFGCELYDIDSVHVIPAIFQEVVDPVGAGDVFIATMASMFANGRDMKNAAEIASIAAGISIKTLGPNTISLDRIGGTEL